MKEKTEERRKKGQEEMRGNERREVVMWANVGFQG